MRFSFNIYPDTIKRIQDFGLEKRLYELKNSEEGLGYIGGYVSSFDIARSVEWLKKDGYYQNIPDDFKKVYKETMNAMLNNPEKFFWTVTRNSNIEKEPCLIADLQLFTGEIASYILKPDEIWDYKKFGFSSPTAFIGAVSAYIIMESRSRHKEGYVWMRKKSDDSEIITEITGDSNADLRVLQTDITPYKTIDPFGNETEFRPETSDDKNCMLPYHSTEPSLFVAVLKYIEQKNIKTSFFEDKGQALINWAETISHGAITCTEHFGGGYDNPEILFINHMYPIPQLDKNYSTEERNIHSIHCMSEGWYSAYIDHYDNLIFTYENKDNMNNTIKNPGVTFTPSDAEELIKGLIYQSAKHLGRTSVRTLVNMLNYRFSDKFENDMQIK